MDSGKDASTVICGICLENKDKRIPRGLHCLHSFCQKCLQECHTKRIKQGIDTETQIECPVCRKKTHLPPGGIPELPLDFHVQEFTTLASGQKNVIFCQACKLQPANGFCKTCNRRFCKECSEEHVQLPLFAGHVMGKAFCEAHGAALEYVCVTCTAGVCVDCVYSFSHKQHKILEADAGIAQVKTKLNNLKTELRATLTNCSREIKEKLEICNLKQCESEEKIRSAGEDIKKAVDEMVDKMVERHKKQHKISLEEKFIKFEDCLEKNASAVKEIEKLFHENRDHEDILLNLSNVSSSADKSLLAIRKAHQSLPMPVFLSSDCCRVDGLDGVINVLKKCTLVCGVSSALSTSRDMTPSPVLVKRIVRTEDTNMETPWNVSTTSDGNQIICNYNGGPAYRIQGDCKVEVLHDVDSVTASCASGEDVYLICRDGDKLVKISPGSTKVIKLKLSVPRARGLVAVGDNILISNECKIVRHSFKDDTDTVLVDHGHENFMLGTTVGGVNTLVVTERLGNRVLFYDELGKELRRFGQFGRKDGELTGPCGIKRMVNGNFLLADWHNNRISEYDTDGTFVRNVLTKDDGLCYPCDVALRYPYLWVIECVTDSDTRNTHKSVKLFKYTA